MNITLKQARQMREFLLTTSSEELKNGWKSVLNKDILNEDNDNNIFDEDVNEDIKSEYK